MDVKLDVFCDSGISIGHTFGSSIGRFLRFIGVKTTLYILGSIMFIGGVLGAFFSGLYKSLRGC